MNVIDGIAWQFIRFAGLMQAGIGEFLLLVIKPVPYEKPKLFQILSSLYMSGLMMFQSQTPDDFPDTIRPQLIFMGRMILITQAFLFLNDLYHVLFMIPYPIDMIETAIKRG